MTTTQWENNEEIKIFQEYLRIPSVHPNIDFEPCVDFLKRQAASLNLECQVHRLFHEKFPIIIITWIRLNPELPTIMLNSHMDVVPVFENFWTHPPFAAEIDGNGRIYARGSQDMKCVAVQYLAAIRALKRAGKRLKRSLHLVFVPDEETDAKNGTSKLVHHDVFKALNIGFALDEGMASETDVYKAFYGERSNWKIQFECGGRSGHGSFPLENTAGEKLAYIMGKLSELRNVEVKKLQNNTNLTIGDITTVNLTILNGGTQSNVVPPIFSATYDVRIANGVDLTLFQQQLNQWCEEAGGDIVIKYPIKYDSINMTELNDANIYWMAFNAAITNELQLKLKTCIFPGNTDISYLRDIHIPAIGFSPIINTLPLLHEHDEFLPASEYLKGIEIYTTLLYRIGNV